MASIFFFCGAFLIPGSFKRVLPYCGEALSQTEFKKAKRKGLRLTSGPQARAKSASSSFIHVFLGRTVFSKSSSHKMAKQCRTCFRFGMLRQTTAGKHFQDKAMFLNNVLLRRRLQQHL